MKFKPHLLASIVITFALVACTPDPGDTAEATDAAQPNLETASVAESDSPPVSVSEPEPEPEPVDIRGAIEEENRILTSTFAGGDASAMAAMYTENGQLLPSNSEFITGREQIASFWQQVMDMGITTLELQTLEVEGFGETASEVGRYKLGGDAGEILDQGKYVVVWKKEDGQWKLHRDIWNTNLPAE